MGSDTQASGSLPGVTQLYHEKPRGLTTPVVESLISYIARLAAYHCVTPMRLIGEEIAPNVGKRYKRGIPVSERFIADWRHVLALCGSGPVAYDWTKALEALTGWPDLTPLTLLRLNQMIHVPTDTMLRRERAWCPHCYEQWRNEQKPLYTPLIWMMKLVTRCPIHHVRIVMSCPNSTCGSRATWLVSHYQEGLCPQCGRWLGETNQSLSESIHGEVPIDTGRAGSSVGHDVVSSNSEWQIRVSEIISVLVSVTEQPGPESAAPRGAIARCLSKWQDALTSEDAKTLRRHVGVTPYMVHQWSRGKGKPSLTQFLGICRVLNIAAEDVRQWCA
jgi:TniQ protein